MPVIEKSALVQHTPAEMFELVDRVEDYPKFLPWCAATELHERTDRRTAATIHVNYHGLKLQFSTDNDKQPMSAMNMKLREGPFKRFVGGWRFTPLGDHGCKVEFHLDYEFSSKLMQTTLGPMFNMITGAFVDSFVKRALDSYG